ncbi:MAG: hypothetical protein J7M26_00590, partial [Armatimonadetes bacterium]|nr:hypothetical protein [Armatimonadota bacterium]
PKPTTPTAPKPTTPAAPATGTAPKPPTAAGPTTVTVPAGELVSGPVIGRDVLTFIVRCPHCGKLIKIIITAEAVSVEHVGAEGGK